MKNLKGTNHKIADLVKEELDKVFAQILKNASEHKKSGYHRGITERAIYKTKQYRTPEHQWSSTASLSFSIF